MDKQTRKDVEDIFYFYNSVVEQIENKEELIQLIQFTGADSSKLEVIRNDIQRLININNIITRYINSLDPLHKEIFIKRYMQKNNWRKITSSLHISKDTLYSTLDSIIKTFYNTNHCKIIKEAIEKIRENISEI